MISGGLAGFYTALEMGTVFMNSLCGKERQDTLSMKRYKTVCMICFHLCKEEALAYTYTNTLNLKGTRLPDILLALGGRGKMRNNFHSISFDIFGILKHVKILPVQKINLNKTLILSN